MNRMEPAPVGHVNMYRLKHLMLKVHSLFLVKHSIEIGTGLAAHTKEVGHATISATITFACNIKLV